MKEIAVSVCMQIEPVHLYVMAFSTGQACFTAAFVVWGVSLETGNLLIDDERTHKCGFDYCYAIDYGLHYFTWPI